MAFPATPLDVEVSIALSADLSDPASWSWTNITSYVRENMRIRIRRGRSSERSTMPPSRCTLTVDNTDGRFCRLLPTGAWYGQIDKNTPLRVRVNNGSGYVTRFVGYVSGWPPSWDPSETDQTVTLTADGILRRLGQGRVLRPALERAILGSSPSAYWTLQDESGSTSAASALAGGAPLSANSLVEFGSTALVPGGSSATADLSAGGYLVAPTGIAPGSIASWEMEVCVAWETLPVGVEPVILACDTPGGSIVRWGMVLVDTGTERRLGVWYTDGVNTTMGSSGSLPQIEAGRVYHFRILLEQSGANVNYFRFRDGDANSSGVAATTTLYAPTRIVLGASGASGQPQSLCHVAIWAPARASAATYAAADGYLGEQAHARVERLCDEEGVPVTVTATTSQAMGEQGTDTLVNLLRECATTDFGLLYEPLAAGLAYLSSTERYNLTAAITLDYDAGQIAPPWDPTDDDRDFRNDVTASKSGGSSARVTDEDSIAAVGVYDDTISANTETDEQLPNVAGWAVNLGTVDELRWPAVKPNLLKHPSLIDTWMAADLGDLLVVTDHPSPLAPDDIRQIIEGYDETFGSFEYTAVANLSPASGWDVGEYDDDDLGKLDTAGTIMHVGATSGATSFTVATTVLPKWTTDAGEMPIPILASGQTNSVTAIANVTPSFLAAGTVAHGNNASVTPTMPAGVQAGDLLLVWAAIRNSGTGTVNTPSGYTVLLESGNVKLLGKVHTGTESAPQITFTGGVAGADTSAQMAGFRGVGITVHASTAQLNGSAQDIAYPALDISRDNCVILYLGWKQDDWTSVAAIAGASEIGEPDTTTGDDQGIVWDVAFQTAAAAVASGSFVVTGGAAAISRGAVVALCTDVQTMTVTRGTNGVTKAIAQNEAVNVYRAARLAL